MRSRLDPLLAPRAIAIVGASQRNHHGLQALESLQRIGFSGNAYLVNPARREVWGRPCHPDLGSLPEVPDLAVLVVNAARAPEVADQCAQAGVKALVVNADGFGERGDAQGIELHRQLLECVRRNGLLLCGPNCLGTINVHGAVAGYCGPVRTPVRPGNISFISQSGGNTALFIELAHARNLGLSYVVSSGNEADLDTCDYLEHVIDDPHTAVTCLFVESIRDPRRFLQLATRSTRLGKPVIAIKIGRSAVAQAAARAHTGALVGSDEAVETLFSQAGVLRASTLDEAIDQAALFSLLPRPRWLGGPRLAVFTVGGGLAGLFADLALDRGLQLPPLPRAVTQGMEAVLGERVNPNNPFDCAGAYLREKPAIAQAFAQHCVAGDDFDGVVMLRAVSGPRSLDYLRALDGLARQQGKPVLVSSTIDAPMEDYKRDFMATSALAFVTGLPRLLVGLQAMCRFVRAQGRLQASAPPPPPAVRGLSERSSRALRARASRGCTVLPHDDTCSLLHDFGIDPVPQQCVNDPAEAIAFARRIGYPVAAKLVNSQALTHKTEAGAIHLGLGDDAELAGATSRLLARVREQGWVEDGVAVPVLVQKMVPAGIEVFVGATVPRLGYPPMVVVGTGGTHVELLRDVVRHLAPLGMDDAMELVSRLRLYPLLLGYRGGARHDIGALAQVIVNVGDLICAAGEWVGDVDLNPVMVQPQGQGVSIVDAVVTLAAKDGAVSA